MQKSLPPASALPNDPAKSREVAIGTCNAVHGGWAATGTAVNPKTGPRRYTITVFFTTKDATVQDYARVKVRVGEKKTATWKASAKFRAIAGTRCVIRAVD